MASPALGGPDLSPGGGLAWRSVLWEGEIDIAVAPAMLARVIEAANGDHVVVELGAVKFMDAAGVGALVQARSWLRAAGGDLLVRDPPPRLRWMLNQFDLADLIVPEANYRQTAQPTPAKNALSSSCRGLRQMSDRPRTGTVEPSPVPADDGPDAKVVSHRVPGLDAAQWVMPGPQQRPDQERRC